MKLAPKFIQRSCIEGTDIDLRQAKAVLKYKPDIILFELPCDQKIEKDIHKTIKNLEKASKKYPYAKSDIILLQNIKKLWDEGISAKVFNVDSPEKLRKEFYLFQKPISGGYPAVRRDWLFWVYLYLRDSYMAQNIKSVLDNYSIKKDPTVLVLLQSVHWTNVQFLLSKPTKKEIWGYYFKNFDNLKTAKNIENQIKIRSKVLHHFWVKNKMV